MTYDLIPDCVISEKFTEAPNIRQINHIGDFGPVSMG